MCVLKFIITMSVAREDRTRRRAAARVQSAPVGHRAWAPTPELEAGGSINNGSIHKPSPGEQTPHISITIAALRLHPAGRLSPTDALLFAQELLCYQPTDMGTEI